MKKTAIGFLGILALALAVSGTMKAAGDEPAGRFFQRVGTFANYLNNAAIGDQTVSEIVAATADGMTLVYTDAVGRKIGFIDITNPQDPLPLGTVAVDPDPNAGNQYSPTSVAILQNQYALVAADTSESFANPSGSLIVVDVATRAIVHELDLGGQPDSIKISPDGNYAAIAIENQRDEDVEVDGVEGGIPQLPAGYLVVVDLSNPNPIHWVRHDVSLTGLSSYAPNDPEPEFIDINNQNEAVVTLQENNHVVIVNLAARAIVGHFPAGAVTLNNIDKTNDGVISLSEALADVPREPDAVTWLPGFAGTMNIGTANEGDLFGGSRGFSIFRRNGTVLLDSASSIESLAVQFGHYPEDRSDNKGTEPEAIAYASFGDEKFMFLASERGSFVAVFALNPLGVPLFKQLLPAPLAPEGLLAIPQRNLLIASGEEDAPSFGVRSTVMIYELKNAPPTYPQILSRRPSGQPIPWSALSGMVSMPWNPNNLLGIWDSYYSESKIFLINVATSTAIITGSITLTPQDGTGDYDPEGIAIAPDHTIWIASEGNASDSRPNLLLQVDLAGNVLHEIGLPPEIIACRAATAKRGTLGSGFEGVAVLRSPGFYRLLVAQQRGWDYTTPECEDLDDDADGFDAAGEPKQTRLWIYTPSTGEWDHVSWELAAKPANASWVGLSEITELPDLGGYMLIERDNRTGNFGVLKTLVKISRESLVDLQVQAPEKSVFDLRPSLTATNGWITDKPEGTAVSAEGRVYAVTDNDGVEDWSGETQFLNLGTLGELFP